MITIDSRDEQALRALIFDHSLPASRSACEAAKRIHAFFVKERGWTFADLALYKFRDLALLAQPGGVVLAQLTGPVDWAREQQDSLLKLTLEELRVKKPHRKEEVLKRVGVKSELKDVMQERAIVMSSEDWAYVERLIRDAGGFVELKSKHTSRLLGDSLVKLLEQAYGR